MLNNKYLNGYYFIEIPLYHISNAQITFGNLFGTDKAIEGVQTLENNGKIFCVVEDSVFFPPRSYVVLGKIQFLIQFKWCTFVIIKLLFAKGAEQRRQIGMDNDEELLQFAVRQSLLETGAEEDQVSYYTIFLYFYNINLKIIHIFLKRLIFGKLYKFNDQILPMTYILILLMKNYKGINMSKHFMIRIFKYKCI